MDEVEYNAQGNRVKMVKRPEESFTAQPVESATTTTIKPSANEKSASNPETGSRFRGADTLILVLMVLVVYHRPW